ncbi:MAG: selenide, water dikinase [Solobacterium sp.]|nr:selenide, water dikinase [Solobacterium sp.]
MDVVLKYLSDIRVVIGIAALVVLIIIILIVQKIRSGNARKELEDLEERYNKIKSVPLSFKLNKAVAISRIEPEAMAKVANMKDDFDKAEANLKQIGLALADAEDEIIAGKLKKARMDIDDLEASITLGETQVGTLDSFLDSILEKETAQRQEVNEYKNRFRELKERANAEQGQLGNAWSTIEQVISETESEFSNFEEWMYASDFEKASAELVAIQESLERFEHILNSVPELLEDARGVIPKMAEVVHHDYTSAKNRGVYLKHLQVEQNLSVITNGLRSDLDKLKAGDADGIRENLDDYKDRLSQLSEQLARENDAFDQVRSLANENVSLYKDADKNMAYVSDQYSRLSSRFGLEGMENKIKSLRSTLAGIASRMPKIYTQVQENQGPASLMLSSMKELNQDLVSLNSSVNDAKAEIESAAGGEERARKQLLKLQVIMNQMQVKIAKYKLPSISEQYDADMKKADEYLKNLDALIDAVPLNVQQLNSTLKEAIDFIYRLYNNVNNVVATVMMVENTIVFGNRYRSTYADIDSELTRSELCFRNGDYTQALSIAIATIEKIHPGNYESMIRENSREA